MSTEGQPLRSFLFAPGNHARRVEKALTLDANAVILDLEDGSPRSRDQRRARWSPRRLSDRGGDRSMSGSIGLMLPAGKAAVRPARSSH